MAVTFTLKEPSVLRLPSLALSVIALAPNVAVQAATRFAVTVPLVLVMAETVKPAGTVGAVTTKLPALDSKSLTTATVLLVAAEPCCRLRPTAGVMVGAVFKSLTNSEKVVVELAPQLSVAVTVTV